MGEGDVVEEGKVTTSVVVGGGTTDDIGGLDVKAMVVSPVVVNCTSAEEG